MRGSKYSRSGGYQNPNFHKFEPEDSFDITDGESNSSEEKKAEEPSSKARLLSIAAGEQRKRPTIELSVLVPKKPRTAPKPQAKITPEPKAKIAPKLKLKAPLGVTAEGSSFQELGSA